MTVGHLSVAARSRSYSFFDRRHPRGAGADLACIYPDRLVADPGTRGRARDPMVRLRGEQTVRYSLCGLLGPQPARVSLGVGLRAGTSLHMRRSVVDPLTIWRKLFTEPLRRTSLCTRRRDTITHRDNITAASYFIPSSLWHMLLVELQRRRQGCVDSQPLQGATDPASYRCRLQMEGKPKYRKRLAQLEAYR